MIFETDLLSILRQDPFYGRAENLAPAMFALSLPLEEPPFDYERMLHEFSSRVFDLRGETESFLSERFIEPDPLTSLLGSHELPIPAVLMPSAPPSGASNPHVIDKAVFDYYFDLACRNSASVTDPSSASYRTAVGRLVFRAVLSIKLQQGINPTARYVLDHIGEFDTEGIVDATEPEALICTVGDSRQRITLDAIYNMMSSFRLPALLG